MRFALAGLCALALSLNACGATVTMTTAEDDAAPLVSQDAAVSEASVGITQDVSRPADADVLVITIDPTPDAGDAALISTDAAADAADVAHASDVPADESSVADVVLPTEDVVEVSDASDVADTNPVTDASDASLPLHAALEVEPLESWPGRGRAESATGVSYRARAHGAPVTLTRLRAAFQGSWSSVDRVSVVANEGGVLRGHATVHIPSDVRGDGIDVEILIPITFPVEEWVEFHINFRLAPVVPAPGPVPGAEFARSGAIIRFGLEAGNTTGVWNSSYAGRYNLELHNASGEQVYVSGTTTYREPVEVRRSVPRLTSVIMTEDAALFAEGLEHTLVSWQVQAPVGSPSISWKKMSFTGHMSAYPLDPSGHALTLRSFRFWRDDVLVPATEVRLTNAAGEDLMSSTRQRGDEQLPIIVAFRDDREEIVNEAGHIYRVSAVMEGVILGQAYVTEMLRNEDPGFFSAGLAAEDLLLPAPQAIPTWSLRGPHLVDASGRTHAAYFIWSDLVEPQSSGLHWTSGWVVDGNIARQFIWSR